jgi:hypothetical protein
MEHASPMPKLIVQRKNKRKSVPARTQYGVPSSPFQKLIHTAMTARGFSGRDLAARLTDAGAPTSQSNLWTWLHHPNGYPGARSFKKPHAPALAKILGIRLLEIHAALDASRHIFTPKEQPSPAHAHDSLAALEEAISASSKKYITRARVLHLIRSLRMGSAK